MTTMASSRSRRIRIVVIALVLLALIGGGIWWWWSSQQQAAAADDTLSGSVEATEYQIAPSVSGPVKSVKVSEGDTVEKGDTLVVLDSTVLALQVDQAKEGVTAAKAALTNAKDDSDSTDADIDAARAKVKQAQAQQKLAETQLSYTTVTAPHDGTVTSVTTNAGQNASPAKTVVTLIDPADLFARVYVSETAVGNVKVGDAVTLTTDSSAETFTGTIAWVASEAQFTPNTIQTQDQRVKLVYEVRVAIDDSSGTLKPGMPVDVTLG